MAIKVGQEVYYAQDQFSFFDFDYSPPGQFASSGLTSPESQLLSVPWLIGVVRGMMMLRKYGLRGNLGGFGQPGLSGELFEGEDKAFGYLLFTPHNNTDYINEVDTLLTNGRLGAENKAILQAVYARVANSSNEDEANFAVQQLIAATPGFHSTSSIDRKNGNERLPAPKAQPADVDYKAIVVFNLFDKNI
eukprot:15364814-Ditylum_brightwellii.AAC.2